MQIVQTIGGLAFIALTSCVTAPANVVVPVRGQLVGDDELAIANCWLALYSENGEICSSLSLVSGKFDTAVTSWAPSYSKVVVAVDCPERARFTSKPYWAYKTGDGVDLGRIGFRKR